MARRSFKLKGVEAIEETYKKKLEEAQNANAAELAKLRQECDQAKGATDKVIEGLAKQRPDVESNGLRPRNRLTAYCTPCEF